jgi:hypothetical protein
MGNKGSSGQRRPAGEGGREGKQAPPPDDDNNDLGDAAPSYSSSDGETDVDEDEVVWLVAGTEEAKTTREVTERCAALAKSIKQGRRKQKGFFQPRCLIVELLPPKLKITPEEGAVHTFVTYLSTGSLELSSVSEAIDLYIFALQFSLHHLAFACCDFAERALTLESFYLASRKLRSFNALGKGNYGNDFDNTLTAFVMANYDEFIKGKNGIKMLGVDHFTGLVQTHESGDFEPPERVEPPPDFQVSATNIHPYTKSASKR